MDQIEKRPNARPETKFGLYSVGKKRKLDDFQQNVTSEIGFREITPVIVWRIEWKTQKTGRQVCKILVFGMEGWIQKRFQ